MTRHTGRITTWTLIITLVTTTTLSTGCSSLFTSGSASYNVIIPLGLGGSPGVFNPFGIVQALVNAALGTALGTGDGTAGSGTGAGGGGTVPGTGGVVTSSSSAFAAPSGFAATR